MEYFPTCCSRRIWTGFGTEDQLGNHEQRFDQNEAMSGGTGGSLQAGLL